MDEPDDPRKRPPPPKDAGRDDREARLAAALRANLRRRKAAGREDSKD